MRTCLPDAGSYVGSTLTDDREVDERVPGRGRLEVHPAPVDAALSPLQVLHRQPGPARAPAGARPGGRRDVEVSPVAEPEPGARVAPPLGAVAAAGARVVAAKKNKKREKNEDCVKHSKKKSSSNFKHFS